MACSTAGLLTPAAPMRCAMRERTVEESRPTPTGEAATRKGLRGLGATGGRAALAPVCTERAIQPGT